MTKPEDYIQAAKEAGMASLAFSEHGSVYRWFSKKTQVEQAGIKYIHAAEVYLTETLDEKVRDNYHCILIARNYDGFKELNSLITSSFNRNDNHFYYVPRISFDELFQTTDNIIVTSACVGGVFGKGSENAQNLFYHFLSANPDRCFLEIGHHLADKQVAYNQHMLRLSHNSGVRLIAGTDTHALNETHEEGRTVLQASKNVFFEGEEEWCLRFLTYDELVNMYRQQNALPERIYLEAIENTNVLASMVEPFEVDTAIKYPKIYDNPKDVFMQKIDDGLAKNPYVATRHNMDDVRKRISDEIKVYEATGTIDFMLLQKHIREWEEANGVRCGPGRGSVAGSMVAYLLGITSMDSMRFGLNFSRFMNPHRITNADIDTDYGGKDRDRVKEFLLRDKLNLDGIWTSEIVTFNTIATKGAIRDVARYLEYDLSLVDKITKEIIDDEIPDGLRNQYPELFKYVDMVKGTIVSVGRHAGGVVVTDRNAAEEIGLASIASSEYQISMLDMIELDAMNYVKMDILGVDNIAVINDTCDILGIERITADNIDLNDGKVWQSIRDDTTLIFQWESNSAQAFLRRFMSDETIAIAKQKNKDFSMLKWLSFGNGLLRPACASFRDNVANGEYYDNGLEELNTFLAKEAGHIAMQETIMKFLVEFCGYTEAESDNVRRAIAKKKGTEKLLPEIEERFIEYTHQKHGTPKEKLKEVIVPFLQVIQDASAYAFSWNHSDSYSVIGYICGYLRYYHPVEFLTAALNVFDGNVEKTEIVIKYAKKQGINVVSPKFRYSKDRYFFTKECNKATIAKGLASVKYINQTVGKELYRLGKNEYAYFVDVLGDVYASGIANSRQIETLISIDFFTEFGNQNELTEIASMFEFFKRGNVKSMSKAKVVGTIYEDAVRAHSTETQATFKIDDCLSIMHDMESAIRKRQINDVPLPIKIKTFYDLAGYMGYVTYEEKDRPMLFIKDVRPLRRKSDGKIFGYNMQTHSIGSGKESNMTVFKYIYDKNPVQQGDIVRCLGWEKRGKYFHMTNYRIGG